LVEKAITAGGYEIFPFPRERGLVVDSGRLGTRRHIIHALFEMDVTLARQFMREHKARTGESLSFTAYIVMCLARAIERHPEVQAYKSWRNQLIAFEDVDVVTMIEPAKDAVAIPHIIRAANSKSFREIHEEIRAVQAHPERSEQRSGVTAWGQRVPSIFRMVFFWAMKQNPHWFKKVSGTVVLTSVGMFGGGGGWGITFLPLHTMGITIGGIVEKPGVVDGRIEIREYLDLTLSVDHDIVDGAPAARFANTFRKLVESGCGLESSANSELRGR
jgi:pyruvate/2-oxoglutarate dehydrogenase complex dihydrolipoamide acyltransferase (E2) component